ncbi:DNA recombination/repair protein RecA/RadB, ATP-binding domain protein [Cordyceps fumosorosea ARSEF 2679]|uniref:DNA recombination/repair protein RecA/RadB, ATP-binding domain protein n=1 Tax=Cordyceps fumosorosea (strain ARSEF 2679) TaxID=1081104 RepID=A0A162LD36_CORFA|nr:DNA recombination/repair protein RecA/RadB, ATP-binding domain protein [Cordyceps fumosorosea ARSEF 2679]OAA68894.1 DNA recombination/repair protein RecA/RadB, ATP-binding domain protein [Cordyceps fumosorosea ARSEF 2679]
MSLLNKLAATRNCAVVILSQCATKMQSEHGAAIVPAINATVWEQGVSTRLVMFRNWSWEDRKPHSVFLVGVQRVDGRTVTDVVGNASAFTVESTGVRGVEYEASHPMEMATVAAQQKRNLDQAELEVPDSEDEDYGWAEEDEADLPPPPQQWQGSEDIILGQDVGRSEDEEEEYRSYDEAEEAEAEEEDGDQE